MRDEEPPLPPPSPAPSRLKRTLHVLRSPFRSVSPFHVGSIERAGSAKSCASDGDLARDERTMRKRNKKRAEAATVAGDCARLAAPASADRPKKDAGGFIKRMGSFGKKRTEVVAPAATPVAPPKPERERASAIPVVAVEQTAASAPATEQTAAPAPAAEQTTAPATAAEQSAAEPSTSPIAAEHAVATRPFTKAGWKRNSAVEMEKPVEEPSPESALKRRIAFVAQASEEREGGERGGVGSLEEAVALARSRLAAGAHEPSHSRDDTGAGEEGCADEMPAYGDLIEPERAADGGAVSCRQWARAARAVQRCARAMTFEETADECYLTVCECCGFSAETALLFPSHASASTERREHLYKILVIGELGTGKTSIIKRYVHQFFSQHYRATIGVDFALKVLNWDANTIIRLQLWDIAGQERFGNMTRVYYKEAVGAFIVFDVSRVATFDAVVKWKNDLDTKVQLPDGSPIPCILLANKCDQQKEGIVNSPGKMDDYCREKGFAGWFETSAKENINIEEAARSLVNKILLNDKLLHSNDKDGDKIALEHKIANGENSRAGGGGKSCNC